MKSSLLETQIQVPPLLDRLIPRNWLIDSLEVKIRSAKSVLVSAPAGYGKTTLLAQWARASQYSVAWVSLSEAENDIEHFLRCIYRALEPVVPSIRESDTGILLEGNSPDISQVLISLINFSNRLGDHFILVLDDYHRIKNSEVHRAVAYLLDQNTSTFHLVLSTRTEPPLPLARYRARGQMIELGPGDLRFKIEETEDFLNALLDLHLSSDEIQMLQSQLEGWAAGLRLAALARRRLPDNWEPLISGRNRFLADYFRQDILESISDNLHNFLLSTCILESLNALLCNAVTEKQDGQEMLEILERENLFLIPLDDNREWYRFHNLFADFLRQELINHFPEKLSDLNRRAACWFLENDMAEEAYQHALAAGDPRIMVALFNRYSNAKLYAGEYNDLKRWLEGLPAEWFIQYPVLGLAQAGYLAFTGAFDACLSIVNDVERALKPAQNEDARYQLARVKAVRCFIACIENDMPLAESLADEALLELPADDEGYLPNIYSALGDTYRQNGLWQKAQSCYLKALDYPSAPAIQVVSANIYGAIADLKLQQGQMRAAAHYWREALAATQRNENWGRYPLSLSGWINIRLGELLYEWNEIESAADHLMRGLERAMLGGDIRAQIAGMLLQTRLDLAHGEVEKAYEAIEQARLLVEKAHFPEWTAQFEISRVNVWLAESKIQEAVQWRRSVLEHPTGGDQPEWDAIQLAAARVLVAEYTSGSNQQALALLDTIYNAVKDSGRNKMIIENLLLQALAKWKRGDQPGAMIAMEEALRLAEPEGYIRLFADLGLAMGRLLQEAQSRGVFPLYVAKVLQAFQENLLTKQSSEQMLYEPLTPREQEVLHLVAAGLSNREIADQFVISYETVKKHVGSIMRKLGASNRTDAVNRARRIGLLGD